MNAPLPAKLLPVERAQAILAECTKVDEVRKIADQAAAIRLYFRRQKAALEVQNQATEILLWSQRRLGELTAAVPKSPGGRKPKTAAKRAAVGKGVKLADEGIAPRDARRWQQLASLPVEKVREHIAATKQRTERLTISGTIAAVSHGESYESDEWGTPDELLDAEREVLGGIDLDPMSNERAQKRVRAKRYYTKKDNGLTKQWKGRIHLNPPYSHPLIAQAIAKFIAEHEAGRILAGFIVVNASTDPQWFHDLLERYPCCLTKGRTGFIGPDGKPLKSNRVGQAIFYAGKARARFEAVFGKFGTIVQRGSCGRPR